MSSLDVTQLIDTDTGWNDPRIYTDQEVYDLELERVFGRTWLFLAHASQLPKAGSFVQTYMAEDPVMVVRQRDGSVKAFLNQCRHRGMRICRSDSGVNKTFTCTYHGWAYDLAGNLINVPQEERAYYNEIDKSAWGALKVPRIAEYRGFYFGTWSDETPDFDEYLGDMAFYFDAIADRFDGGIEFAGGTTKWVIDCNWKFASEQFASDMYHAPSSHASAMIALMPEGEEDPMPWYVDGAPGHQFAGGGHGSGAFWAPFSEAAQPQFGEAYAVWADENDPKIRARLGEDRATKVHAHNTIFPNLSFLGGFYTMRVWHPRGPGQIEVWAWTIVPKDAPEAVKAEMRAGTARTFSAAGAFETDDGENWTEIQQVLRGFKARQNKFNVSMGRGHEQRDLHGMPGEISDVFSEAAARGFYQRWNDLLAGMSWADIREKERARTAAQRALTNTESAR